MGSLEAPVTSFVHPALLSSFVSTHSRAVCVRGPREGCFQVDLLISGLVITMLKRSRALGLCQVAVGSWGSIPASLPCEGRLGGLWSPRSLSDLCAFVYSRLQRRQEEGYYSRLEAERRRQHDEAERRLLEPEEPGLCRPPLPRGYEPPSLSPAANAPPPPPQRTASSLQAQALSPDSLYTAKFVAYNEEEEEDGSPAGQDKYAGSTRSPPAAFKPRQPPCQPRPASDGIFLSNSFQPPSASANGTARKAGQPLPPPKKASGFHPSHSKGRGKW